MSIKINGNKIQGELILKGKMYQFTTDFDSFPLSLQRPDTCEVEFSNEILYCTVAESKVKNKYGHGKERVLLLRVDSRKEKAVEKKPIQKVVKPAVTKEFKDKVETKKKSAKKSKSKKKDK